MFYDSYVTVTSVNNHQNISNSYIHSAGW